jgi:hypothetical protein
MTSRLYLLEEKKLQHHNKSLMFFIGGCYFILFSFIFLRKFYNFTLLSFSLSTNKKEPQTTNQKKINR